jgi:hypothetical protein
MLGFSLFGLFVWMMATAVVGVALSNRFRVMTGRTGYRYPERGPRMLAVAQEPVQVIPVRPGPPPFPKGAILIDEAWEEPRQPPRGVDVPPEEGEPPR